MEFILYEVKDMVATITINRPKALNALNSQVLEELDATLDAVDLNTVRCLILTGAGDKSFVAGADIGEMSTLTKAEGEAFGKKGNDVFRKLETFPIPVIAAINGFALGGGCEISMSCDIRICSENSVVGQPWLSSLSIQQGILRQMKHTALVLSMQFIQQKSLYHRQRNLLLQSQRMHLSQYVTARKLLMMACRQIWTVHL